MSDKSYSNYKNRKYLSAFFNRGFIFPALFIALLFTTILAIEFEYNVFSQVTTKNNKIFAVAVSVFYLGLIILYALLSIRKENITLGDAVCVAFLLTGVFYAIYLALSGIEHFSLENIALIFVFVFTGIILTLLKTISYYQANEEKQQSIVRKRSICSYFQVVNKEFRFFRLILTSIIIFSIFYLILDLKYDVIALLEADGINSTSLFFPAIKDIVINNYLYLSICGVGGLCLVFYAIICAFDNNFNSLDMFLTAFYVTIPVIGAMFYLLGDFNSINDLIILGGFTFAVILLTIFRVIFLNRYKILGEKNSTFCKKLIVCKETLKSIFLSALIVVFSNITIELEIFSACVKDENLNIYIGLFPYAFICIACIISVVAFGLEMAKSIFKLGSKKFESCDKYIVYNFMLALFLLTIEIVSPIVDGNLEINITNIVIVASYLFISFGTMLMRRKSAKMN